MSTSNITTKRQRELIHDLTELVALRATDEVAIRERDTQRQETAKADYEEQRRKATQEFEEEHARLIATYLEKRHTIYTEYETQGCAVTHEEEHLLETASKQATDAQEVSKHVLHLQREKIRDAFEKAEAAVKRDREQAESRGVQLTQEIEATVATAQKIVRRRCDWPDDATPAAAAAPGLGEAAYWERAQASLAQARELIEQIRNQPAARFLERGWLVLVFFLALAVLAIPAWVYLAPTSSLLAAAATFAASVVLTAIVRYGMFPFAERQTLRLVPAFQQLIAQARVEIAAALAASKARAKQLRREAAERHPKERAEAEAAHERSCREQAARQQAKVQQSAAEFTNRRRRIEEPHERLLQEVEETYPRQIAELEATFSRRVLELSDAFRTRRAENERETQREARELGEKWTHGLARFRDTLGEMNEFCETHFPPWETLIAAGRHTNGAGSLPALRFGRFQFPLGRITVGVAADAAPTPAAEIEFPAVLSTPDSPSLLIEAEGEGRELATRCLQNVMLRMLTSYPPGKVRFTIIDPVGLGQNFSAFMHLADFDERLVTNRIWTESAHLQQRLADLTEHMEKVIQKYLRNEFASIQEYNEQAGEVAEPFQILVVANFPANFSDEAARRLVSIAHSGAKCGVYTLISTDQKLKLPRNFDLADLESQAATLLWDETSKSFHWKHDELKPFPVTFDSPPDEQSFTDIVCAVGQGAKDASRVEVPFTSIVPTDEQWWTFDSRSGVDVPLGRAGAKKLQYMRLGKGTSQHVLISGKTGSGKSTLLNALITSLSVHYAPSEIQFYLIDFKKGVEFKAYAAFRLPHARVIAIESEREFGMSVLERLDQELKRRGDLYRQHGVQNLEAYRNSVPDAVMPRILLIIDEFQEFFTSDDKISHDSALLLDRLVRQGRAFGIHVLLGSQTLAGAYSLARSTIGQMAVRIALQCSESDAHLILSEDNTAARLLNRPGEAIYNDANGLLEGNHPFQIVWLSDEERESYLRRVAEMARERQVSVGAPIVFEGNVAADPSDNDLLQSLIKGPPPSAALLAPRVWLGSAVAIKDPTDMVFRRQGGSNLLLAGQQEELAHGILANALVALRAQIGSPVDGANGLYILDGTLAESAAAGYWKMLSDKLSLGAQIVAPWDAGRVVKELAAEVERRQTARDQNSRPLFLLIDNLARFRDLKKSDDFGFGEADTGVEKQLAAILRDGPTLGVHTMAWCDSFGNLNRWLNRQTLRDFGTRVLFQMSAADSSNLMDSPAASRLGAHMAVCYSEDQGQAEKFRPYGLPDAKWLEEIAGIWR